METRWVEGRAGRIEVRHLSANGPDVLLVHGAWSSSWYWEEHFMAYLAERGFSVSALNLRAHGKSAGRFRWSSLGDYVSDVRAVAETLDDPIIVGHSLGGFITQRYVHLHGARAAALLASVPHFGAWKALWKVVSQHPGAFLRTMARLNLLEVVAREDAGRALLYSRGPDQTDKDHFLQHRYDESFRIFIDLLVQPILKPWPKDMPKFVMGAENDQLFSPADVKGTARHHRTEATFIAGASHMLMVDDQWEEAASALTNWLESLS